MKTLQYIFLAALSLNAAAENLSADAILCESPEAIGLLQHPDLKNLPGSEVWKRVTATAQNTDAGAEPYKEFLATCSISENSGSVVVLESRPVREAVKVKTKFNGRTAELWTSTHYVSKGTL